MNKKTLYRILSGQIIIDIGRIYVLKPNKNIHKYRAEIIYEETLQNCIEDGVLSKEDMKFRLLLFKNKLPPNYQSILDENRAKIDDKKIELYETFKEKKNTQFVREEIGTLMANTSDILEKLHSMDSLSAEGIAEMAKSRYLICRGIGQKLKDSELDMIMMWLSQKSIRESDFRKIARSNQFFNMASTSSLFQNKTLTDEQLTLMYWHRFYKSVLEHPEKPFDWIIEDDWALDGWYLHQSRKAGKAESINYVEGKMHSDSVRGSQEVYVFGGQKMAKTVYEANDASTRAYIKARETLINKGKFDANVEQKLGQGFGIG